MLRLWAGDCPYAGWTRMDMRRGLRTQIVLLLLATSAVLLGQQYPPSQQQFPQQPGAQQAEPQDQPGQPVARLGVINGEASVRRGDSGEWVAAALNAPLMAGDSVSVAPNGSAE